MEYKIWKESAWSPQILVQSSEGIYEKHGFQELQKILVEAGWYSPVLDIDRQPVPQMRVVVAILFES